MSESRISKEQLETDLKNSLTFQEISEKHGYYSKAEVAKLVDRKDLSVSKNTKISFLKHGAANIYLSKDEIGRVLEANDVSRSDDVFVEKTFEDGQIKLSLTGQKWTESE